MREKWRKKKMRRYFNKTEEKKKINEKEKEMNFK